MPYGNDQNVRESMGPISTIKISAFGNSEVLLIFERTTTATGKDKQCIIT